MNAGLETLRSLPTMDLVFLIGVPLFWLLHLPVFLVRCAIWGVPKSERVSKMKSKVVPRVFAEYGYWMLSSQVKFFVRLGITADMMTALSLVTALGGGVFLAMGRFGLGGWLMFFSFFCDAYDGMVARHTNSSSDRGEFFDSVVDRYADTIIMLGFLCYYRNDPLPASLFALALIGSTVMGYAKAKGEAVGVDPSVGMMQRNERAAYLGVATVTSSVLTYFVEPGAAHPMHHLVLIVMVPIAFFTNLTAIWRTAYVMRRMPRTGSLIKAPVAAPAQVATKSNGDAAKDAQLRAAAAVAEVPFAKPDQSRMVRS